MSTHAAETSIGASVVVAAPIERAFTVFTKDPGRFKPLEHTCSRRRSPRRCSNPRVGGHLYDRGVDGSECRWARVPAYEPPQRVLFSWARLAALSSRFATLLAGD